MAELTDAQIVALTIFGEARDQQVEGRVAVGSVIRNRLHDGRWGHSYRDVCLAKAQFSCWRPVGGLSNYNKLQLLSRAICDGTDLPLSTFEAAIYRECVWVADGILSDSLVSSVRNATHYITTSMLKADPPTWAKGVKPAVSVGRHAFFEGIA